MLSFLNAQNTIPANKNNYHYRKPTIPLYGLEKVKHIISQTPGRDGYMNRPIPQRSYDSLSLTEKFTYAMIHPETYLQNCSFYGELNSQGKVFGRLSLGFNENMLSKRQLDFLQAHRDSVLMLIRNSYQANSQMGINFKQTIVAINGWEIIPLLIDYYNKEKKDSDVLCTLMILMKNGYFNKFIESDIYQQLYSKGKRPFYATIDHNPKNAAFILKTAVSYFSQLKKANPKSYLVYY